jgi:1-acyl-sn-glycerol-3-phosphate acyltransferase
MTLYGFGRVVMSCLLHILFRIDVEGADNVPKSGPVILVANHGSNWDPPLMGICAGRPLFFMAKEQLFRRRWLGALLRAIHGYPIRRGAPDRVAMRQSLSLLHAGEVLMIFPQGHRSKGLADHIERGAATLAVQSGATVVPAAILASYRPLSRVRIRFGTPLSTCADGVEDNRPVRARTEEMRREIAARIRALQEQLDVEKS